MERWPWTQAHILFLFLTHTQTHTHNKQTHISDYFKYVFKDTGKHKLINTHKQGGRLSQFQTSESKSTSQFCQVIEISLVLLSVMFITLFGETPEQSEPLCAGFKGTLLSSWPLVALWSYVLLTGSLVRLYHVWADEDTRVQAWAGDAMHVPANGFTLLHWLTGVVMCREKWPYASYMERRHPANMDVNSAGFSKKLALQLFYDEGNVFNTHTYCLGLKDTHKAFWWEKLKISRTLLGRKCYRVPVS